MEDLRGIPVGSFMVHCWQAQSHHHSSAGTKAPGQQATPVTWPVPCMPPYTHHAHTVQQGCLTSTRFPQTSASLKQLNHGAVTQKQEPHRNKGNLEFPTLSVCVQGSLGSSCWFTGSCCVSKCPVTWLALLVPVPSVVQGIHGTSLWPLARCSCNPGHSLQLSDWTTCPECIP